MSIRPWRDIYRRQSRQISVGKVKVGGDAPITVQSMTNTLTTDVAATIEQIRGLEIAGADIVRVSVPDEESSRALKDIVSEVTVPIVADIAVLELDDRGLELTARPEALALDLDEIPVRNRARREVL